MLDERAVLTKLGANVKNREIHFSQVCFVDKP
jgi:hypothetical protein